MGAVLRAEAGREQERRSLGDETVMLNAAVPACVAARHHAAMLAMMVRACRVNGCIDR